MNKTILNTAIQNFINDNINSDIPDLILKGIPFSGVTPKEVIEQIEAKKKSKKKLPTWYGTDNIYYPNKLNIEQTSSEKAAKYKASIVSGDTLIDLTGGFGVDSFYFAKHIKEVTHCEIHPDLSEIARYNYSIFGVRSINCINDDGISVLKRLDKSYDWIYVDPSRRDDNKNKVFLLSDCTPNVKTFQGLFLKYAKNVLIKTSPLIDITHTFNDLKSAKALHILAINNEVKELLWVIERDYTGDLNIKTVNIEKSENQSFEFNYTQEREAIVSFNEPRRYLYEPNAAILKSGAFNTLSETFQISKFHSHTHLYTSDELIDFPGRRFLVEKYIPFNKKQFAREGIKKANVTTRNFPLSVAEIRKQLKLTDGGNVYLFFTSIGVKNKKYIVICSKV